MSYRADKQSDYRTHGRTDGRTDTQTDAGNDNTQPKLASGKNPLKYLQIKYSTTVSCYLLISQYCIKPLNHCGQWCHIVTQIRVNIGSSNGLLPDGTNPLTKPMLTCDPCVPVAFTWKQFCSKYSKHWWIKCASKSHVQNYIYISQGQWVNKYKTPAVHMQYMGSLQIPSL